MKKYFFPMLIIILGLSAAYLFYALWHSDELNTSVAQNVSVNTNSEHPFVKKIIPKNSVSTDSLKSVNTKTSHKAQTEMPKRVQKQSDSSKTAPEEIEAEVQATYESLMPDDYEETMQKADITFEQLDETVEVADEKLAEEMQAIEEQIVIEKSTVETVEDKTLSMPENEEEEIIFQEEEIAD